mgnify:CR=1 FL=1
MRKENVFLVTARPLQSAASGSTPHGQLQQFVICASDELQLHSFVNSALPQSAVIGVASLAALEETVGQIKSALARAAGSLPVYVDPAMSRNK